MAVQLKKWLFVFIYFRFEQRIPVSSPPSPPICDNQENFQFFSRINFMAFHHRQVTKLCFQKNEMMDQCLSWTHFKQEIAMNAKSMLPKLKTLLFVQKMDIFS